MPDLLRRCVITIDTKAGVSIAFDPQLPDGPHELSWVEKAAAGAVLGIGKALTGKGGMEIVSALKVFARSKEARKA